MSVTQYNIIIIVHDKRRNDRLRRTRSVTYRTVVVVVDNLYRATTRPADGIFVRSSSSETRRKLFRPADRRRIPPTGTQCFDDPDHPVCAQL